ncbi:MAG: hypothetical protein WEG36_12135 [Gemmatimonadota bacterium]
MLGRVRKLFAAGFIAGVLGFQAWVIAPGTPGGWYWPFLDYPMYSRSVLPETPYRERRLALVPLSSEGLPGDTLRLAAEQMGFYSFTLRALAETIRRPALEHPDADEAQAREARIRIARTAGETLGLDRLEVILEEQTFQIARDGLVSRDPPWLPVDSWVAGPETLTAPEDPTP